MLKAIRITLVQMLSHHHFSFLIFLPFVPPFHVVQNARPSIRRDDTCKNEGMFAIRNSCNQFVRCYRTAGGHFAKFRYRCPEDFFYFRNRCMSTSSLRQLGITCPYYMGPSQDDQHYIPTPIDTTIKNNSKVEYPLKKPDFYPEIIDMERQDIDNYDSIYMPAPN